LEPKDFDQWEVFSKEYFKELHLLDDLKAEDRSFIFHQRWEEESKYPYDPCTLKG